MTNKSKIAAFEHQFANAEEERQEKRQLREAYNDAALQMQVLLHGVKKQAQISKTNLESLKKTVFDIYKKYDSSWLFESISVPLDNENYQSCHAISVSLLVIMIAEAMAVTPEKTNTLVEIALVHDLGMAQMSQNILYGRKALTLKELEQVHRHPALSVALLKNSGITDEIIGKAVLHHHERYNGSGYPDRLVGEQIPIEARIVAIADTYDAATTKKYYKKQLTPFEILEEFAKNENRELDPKVLKHATKGISALFIGQQIVLSNQTVGIIIEMHQENLAYPLVRILGRHIQTGPHIHPVAITRRIPMF